MQYGGGIVLAIDPATRTGVASGRPGTTPLLTTIDLAREFDDYEDIFGRAITWFSGKLDDGPPELVIIEGQGVESQWLSTCLGNELDGVIENREGGEP